MKAIKEMRCIGFEKDYETNFYRLELSDEYFSNDLIADGTIRSVFECDICNLTVNVTPLQNSKVVLVGSREQIMYYNPWNFVATNDMIKMFEKYSILGFQTKDISLTASKLSKEHIDNLREILITGRVYAVYNADGDMLEVCPQCYSMTKEERLKTKNGIKFSHDYWDGSDIFKLETVGHIFVTDKFKDMIEKENIEGINFIPLENVKFC